MKLQMQQRLVGIKRQHLESPCRTAFVGLEDARFLANYGF